ncbi:MAG: transglycosylase SLT domain-containing protein [Thiomargarita sp.]|nr:transglycosylase SLT domain-containing protein [Thiomargarita sp.]
MDRPNRSGRIASWFERIFGKTLPPQIPKPRSSGNFNTIFDYNNPTMLKQLNEAKRYKKVIEDAARRYDIAPSIICGIGSRESHWGLALTPKGPSGRGDFARRRPRGERYTPEPLDGPGYGRGLLQIDYDWHEIARIGKWYKPRENIMYGCNLLNKSRNFFEGKTNINLNDESLLRAMLASYNGGATATFNAIKAGKDVDASTTGRDYSKDVLNRSGWFQLHGWG